MPAMAKEAKEHANLLQGFLEMLILRTLFSGSAHGRQIGNGPQMISCQCSTAGFNLHYTAGSGEVGSPPNGSLLRIATESLSITS